MRDLKLTIELIPATSFCNNIRTLVTRKEWNKIRLECYEKAGHKCEICGRTGLSQGFKHAVECHELWKFNEIWHIQELTGFIALCPLCHKTKHIGLAGIQGFYSKVKRHFIEVNHCPVQDFYTHEKKTWDIWKERSKHTWEVDINYLKLTQ